jgi:hypothetical protein
MEIFTNSLFIVTAYTDLKCTEGKAVLAPKQCSNNKVGYQAWSITCDYKD